MKSNQQTTNILLIGAGAFIGYKFVLVPLLEALNLKDTAAEKAAAEAAAKYGGNSGLPVDQNPWSPKYVNLIISQLKKGQSAALLTVAQLNKLSNAIRDAKSMVNDDEEAVYGALRSITSNTQLSQLAGHFNSRWSKDLYEYIAGIFNDAELNKVINIVKGYKKGIIQSGKIT